MSKNPQTPQLPKELSRKYLSRAERDARNTRILLLTVGGAIVLALLLIGFGIFRDNVLLPNEPVARVGDQDITTREFWQRVRLQRFQLINEYNLYLSIGLNDNAGQALQQLSDPVGLGSQVISAMVDEALFRQAAPDLGVSVPVDEVQKSIEEGFGYFRVTPTPRPTNTPRPTLTPSPTVTGTAAETITATPAPTTTPAPTSTPDTAEGFQQLYAERVNELSGLGFSEADYRRLWETQLIAQKVQELLQSQVATTTEQAQFRTIRATSPADMDRVQQAVAQDGFDAVYTQVLSQTFTITSVAAVEFPYTPKFDLEDSVAFGSSFADAVFSTPISGTFGVISNTANSIYYIGRVLNRETRELTSDALQRLQSKAVQDWLNERRQIVPVEVLRWEDRVPTDPAP